MNKLTGLLLTLMCVFGLSSAAVAGDCSDKSSDDTTAGTTPEADDVTAEDEAAVEVMVDAEREA